MTGTTLDAPFIAPSISPARRSWRRYRAGILFVLPALILYLVFMVYPFFQSIYFSFTSWNGVTAVKEWVGLANYRELIGDDLFWLSLQHTVIWVIVGTIAPIVIGMLLAILLWRRPKGFTLFRTFYFMPQVLSAVVIGIVWNWIYNPIFGILNESLDAIRVRGPFTGMARRSGRRALRGAHRGDLGHDRLLSSSSSWPVCRMSARISWKRRPSMARTPGSVSGM